jgi:hypothetical protein
MEATTIDAPYGHRRKAFENMIRTALSGILALALLSAAPAIADVAASLKVQREVVKIENGRRIAVRETIESARPDETVFYSIELSNSDAIAATDVHLVFPVDASLQIDATWLGGELPAGIAVSVDGGKTFGDLTDLTVQKGGKSRPATADDITHLQLVVSKIPAGKTGSVEYRAVVR